MKTITISFFLALFIISCNYPQEKVVNNKKQIKKQYTIEGRVINKNGEMIFLSDSTGNVIQQKNIQNDVFSFVEIPQKATLFLHFQNGEKTALFSDTIVYKARVWDNNTTKLFIESENLTQKAYNSYQIKLANLDRELLNAYRNNEPKTTITKIAGEKIKIIENFIVNNKENFIGIFELEQNKLLFPNTKLSELYATLSDNLQKTDIGKELKSYIDSKIEEQKKSSTPNTSEKTQPTVVKKREPERFPAPEFSGLTPQGYLVQLKDIVANNKIIMLDFWGSWCQPCRMQNPFWVRLYKKYKSLGFEIISIAEETEESRPHWQPAIEKDQMTWTNIIDENNKIAETYRAYSLPHAVLIDKNGKIIYNKASARDVQEYLMEYFKE